MLITDKEMFKGAYAFNLHNLIECKCKIKDLEIDMNRDNPIVRRGPKPKIPREEPKSARLLRKKVLLYRRNKLRQLRRQCDQQLKKYSVNNLIYSLLRSEHLYTEVDKKVDTNNGISEIKYVYGYNNTSFVVNDRFRFCETTGEFNRVLHFKLIDSGKEIDLGTYRIAKMELLGKFIYHTFGETELVNFLYNFFNSK